jgi:adenosylhomocysteine nucleosidase
VGRPVHGHPRELISQPTMASVLLLVPDPDEAGALLHEFTRHGHVTRKVMIGNSQCTELPSLHIVLAVGGNGKSQFGIRAQYFIDRCPETTLLLCVGAAGSLCRDVHIGDVVVASSTIEHDYKRRITPKSLPRYDADPAQLQRFRRAAELANPRFRVHFGIIASGDEDVVDPVRATEIQSATGALCAAWEGSGGARAARVNDIGFCEVRGITDMADAQAAQHFHQNVQTVMLNVARLILAWRGC